MCGKSPSGRNDAGADPSPRITIALRRVTVHLHTRDANRPSTTALTESRRNLTPILVAVLFLSLGSVYGAGPNSPIEFNRDVRPILSDNCFQCHGPDKNKRKAGLRLDTEEGAFSKTIIVPG